MRGRHNLQNNYYPNWAWVEIEELDTKPFCLTLWVEIVLIGEEGEPLHWMAKTIESTSQGRYQDPSLSASLVRPSPKAEPPR